MGTTLVGIGCDVAQELAAEVLRFSIERHARVAPAICKLHSLPQWHQMAADLKQRQRTPFSFQRFLLARQLLDSDAEFGVYVDSDMLVLRPIEELIGELVATRCSIATVSPLPEWRRRRQSSVMAMNREGASELWSSYERFLAGKMDYNDLIYLRTISKVGDLSYSWNCLEYLDETTALIHYTDMDTQPWLRDGHPCAGIWYTYLWRFAQLPEGRKLLLSEIERRHVRPALAEVISVGPSITSFSRRAKLGDLFFVPPHRFRRVRWPAVRLGLAPLLRLLISFQFLAADGQPNIR